MTRKERYYFRKDNGICVDCGKNPAQPNRVRCEECAERARVWTNEDRAALVKMGICPKCRKNPISGYSKMCEECREKFYDYEDTHGITRIKSANQVAKEKGLCIKCGARKPVQGKTKCAICAKKDASRMREYRKRKSGCYIERCERYSYGLCWFCGKPVAPGYKVCEEHREMCERISKSKNTIKARKKLRKQCELY